MHAHKGQPDLPGLHRRAKHQQLAEETAQRRDAAQRKQRHQQRQRHARVALAQPGISIQVIRADLPPHQPDNAKGSQVGHQVRSQVIHRPGRAQAALPAATPIRMYPAWAIEE